MSNARERRRVVITGMGMLSPVGNTVEASWDALLAGTPGGGTITQFEAGEGFATKIACEVKGFDPGEHLDRKESRRWDRFAQFAVVAADQAMASAGLEGPPEGMAADRFGVIIGSGIGGMDTFESNCRNPDREGPGPGQSVLRAHVHPGHRGGPRVDPIRTPGTELLDGLGVRLERPRHRGRRPVHRAG